jgi:exodeoxyribonuclease VII large subunit
VEGQLTLSELNSLVKKAMQSAFPEQLWVIAEIAEMKVNRSGHCYLELVDKDPDSEDITARARATIWSWQYRFIQPYFETITGQSFSAGLKVLLSVTVEFHEAYGYSLNIKDIDPNYTLGDLVRKRMEIIRRLTEEGVIDMNKEIPVPDIPSRIAVISSPTAAGYEDFINQLLNNPAGYKFYTKLFPATMQGNDAPASVMAALDVIYEWEDRFDVVVIIRGGGSQLDLSCFDDYQLALHISQFSLPILTGIGHEKDDTIADMVANTRLKTPTAVAGFLIARFDEAASEIADLESNFMELITSKIEEENSRIESAVRILKPLVNARLERIKRLLDQYNIELRSMVREEINQQQFRLVHWTDVLMAETGLFIRDKNRELSTLASKSAFKVKFELNGKRQNIISDERRLLIGTKQLLERQDNLLRVLEKNKELVDPKTILNRGFSITLKEGKVVKDASELQEDEELETLLAKGKVGSTVKFTNTHNE